LYGWLQRVLSGDEARVYYTDLVLQSDSIQEAYFRADARVVIRGGTTRGEVALISAGVEFGSCKPS
jgi:hypothetical protein